MSNQKLADALRAILPAARANALPARIVAAAEQALAEHDAQPTGFTVFLRTADGTGTTHISFQEAGDANEAINYAAEECRRDWNADLDDDLHVLGVAAGDVTIVEWDDLT